MNRREMDVLLAIHKNGFWSQREVAESCGYSLGTVNAAIKNLIEEGLLSKEMTVTSTGENCILNHSPKRAVILAAGYGMRMVPISTHCSKALLEINGETLIERLIRQLQENEIREIYVVVGYMKEAFEFLMDEYGVKLIVNNEYSAKNNLHSLTLAGSYLRNAYIIPCDIWCKENPFRKNELYSWYMLSDEMLEESTVKINRKQEIRNIASGSGNRMIGIAYLTEDDAEKTIAKLQDLDCQERYDHSFWETALELEDKWSIEARIVEGGQYIEINTYEQLREVDSGSNHLQSPAMEVISKTFHVQPEEISHIETLKKGMTNRSFVFECKGKKYIMRIPGEGTDQLINRKEEAEVYGVIQEKGICDEIHYIDPQNGYKISAMIEDARVCDPDNEQDLVLCMDRLRSFHKMGLKVEHTFDIFGQIDFYESLWDGQPSVYRDYSRTKDKIMSLRKIIDSQKKDWCLTHIDAVPDNFLFDREGNIRLIDWEYAGMQDPHVDIAMFCIYALYDREQVDHLIDLYFQNKCDPKTRRKIYCYIASCGLLWSNWCEYKRNLGVEFGEYSIRQYRYAKDYYKIVMEEWHE